MEAIPVIAESKIRTAIENGEFDNLPGHGKPLELGDLARVPPELRMSYKVLRMSYKVLRNAGCLARAGGA